MQTIPVLGTRGSVMFPGMRCGVVLSTAPAEAAVRAAVAGGRGSEIALFATRSATPRELYEVDDLYSVGTIARIAGLARRRCCRRWVVLLAGVGRARSLEYVRWEPFREARVEPLLQAADEPKLVEGLVAAVRQAVAQLTERRVRCRHVLRTNAAMRASRGADDLAGAVAPLLLDLPLADRQRLLETEPVSRQLAGVLTHLHGLLAALEGEQSGGERAWQ